MSDAVRDKVIAIIAGQAIRDVSDVQLEMTLADLGIDSLGLVESVFAFEEAFGISVPFNASDPSKSMLDISTVGSVVAAVERLVAERAV